jgi:hypothetical protein
MDPFMGPSSDTLFSGWGPPKTFSRSSPHSSFLGQCCCRPDRQGRADPCRFLPGDQAAFPHEILVSWNYFYFLLNTTPLAVEGLISPEVRSTRGNRCSCGGEIPRPLAAGIAKTSLPKIYLKPPCKSVWIANYLKMNWYGNIE